MINQIHQWYARILYYLVIGIRLLKTRREKKIKLKIMGNTSQNFGITLGQNMATEAASGILGIAMGAYNDRRQVKQQQRLQDQQIAGQKQMTDYNMEKQYQMWLKTNYGAQMEQMKKAGLNPGLMYGMSGGGGTTTGNASGSVQGATAPQGGREMIDINAQMMQLQLLKAQKENIEADTKNKLGDAANKPLTGENIQADTELKKVRLEIDQVASEIAGKTQNMQIATINTALRKATEELQILANQKKISDATMQTEIEQVKQNLAQTVIENELKRVQTEATKQGMQKTVEEIEKIRQEVTNLKNYYDLDNFIEREKVRLIDKGINVALISSTIGAVMHVATGGRR